MDPAKTSEADARHRAVVGRILRWQLVFAVAGLVAWGLLRGQREAISFGVGAVASLASFSLLDRLSGAVAGGAVSGSGMALSVVRMLLIGGALFAIIRSYSIHSMALGTGILITVAAITMESLLNQFHA